jgi:hypothetical protein
LERITAESFKELMATGIPKGVRDEGFFSLRAVSFLPIASWEWVPRKDELWRLMDKFCEEYKKAEWLGDKAEDSKRHQQRKKSAMAMSNRLEKLEKELERIRRNLQASVKNSREENAQECRRIMTILACEIIPLKYALKDMGGTPFEKLEKPLQPGDYIRGRHGAGWVIRVNKTTITI